jgi:hypothetical protein
MKNLVELMKIAAMEAVDQRAMSGVLFGTVVSIKPLIIETDQKLRLTHEFLIVARALTDYTFVISFDDESIK